MFPKKSNTMSLEEFIADQCREPSRQMMNNLDNAACSFESTTAMLSALAVLQDREFKDDVGAKLIRDFMKVFAAHEKDRA